jgi:hypothetical protein
MELLTAYAAAWLLLLARLAAVFCCGAELLLLLAGRFSDPPLEVWRGCQG